MSTQSTGNVRQLTPLERWELAELVVQWLQIARRIATLIGRRCTPGNIGEAVAASVSNIRLEKAGNVAGRDGHFLSGPLAGQSVNIKSYQRGMPVLKMNPKHPPHTYLVLRGLLEGTTKLYQFDTEHLVAALKQRGIQIRQHDATHIPADMWEDARLPLPQGLHDWNRVLLQSLLDVD